MNWVLLTVALLIATFSLVLLREARAERRQGEAKFAKWLADERIRQAAIRGPVVPASQCPSCQLVGFVRTHPIEGPEGGIASYCERCEFAWLEPRVDAVP